jgi:hypothetical protein
VVVRSRAEENLGAQVYEEGLDLLAVDLADGLETAALDDPADAGHRELLVLASRVPQAPLESNEVLLDRRHLLGGETLLRRVDHAPLAEEHLVLELRRELLAETLVGGALRGAPAALVVGVLE